MIIDGATAFAEWQVRLAGQVATCVECAEMICNHMVAARAVSAAEDTWLAQDLINRGQASANGATNYLAASQQMTRLGIANTAYGADWFRANDFVPVVIAALNAHIPVLFGLYAAYKLYNDWTGQPEDAGVFGHGVTLVGYDATGAIVADPNTSEALQGKFVHYTWQRLRDAGGDWPSMVIPNKGALSMAWTKQTDGTGKDSRGHVCGTGLMYYITSKGYQMADAITSEQPYTATDLVMPLIDGHILTAHNNNGAWSFDEQGAQAVAALLGSVAALKAQIAATPAPAPTPPPPVGLPTDVRSSLTDIVRALAPLAQACSEAQKALDNNK